jgi:hypothetical protein
MISKYDYNLVIENTWTSYSDIGRDFSGVIFYKDEYIKMENLYIQSIILILGFFKAKKIIISHILKLASESDFIKNKDFELYDFFKNIEVGMQISDLNIISKLIALRLREYIVELEFTFGNNPKSEIIFGFDYYMYLKTNKNIILLNKKIIELGLHVGN